MRLGPSAWFLKSPNFGAWGVCLVLKKQAVKAGSWWLGHAMEDMPGHAQKRHVFNWRCANCSEYMGLYITFREEQQSRSTRKRTKETKSSRWLFSWHTKLSRFERQNMAFTQKQFLLILPSQYYVLSSQTMQLFKCQRFKNYICISKIWHIHTYTCTKNYKNLGPCEVIPNSMICVLSSRLN